MYCNIHIIKLYLCNKPTKVGITVWFIVAPTLVGIITIK